MEQFMWETFIVFALLTTVIPSTKSTEQAEARVYRFTKRDVFKNPKYTSYIDCGVNSCTQYQAKCLEDGNCCLCRCTFKLSTYNVSEGRCVADETILSASDSAFRLIRNDKLQTDIPIITLNEPKTLGQIVIVKRNSNSTLKKCKVLMKASHYWSDNLSEDWKPLLKSSYGKLFGIRVTKSDVTLEWVYGNSTRNSWFHGLVFRLSIQCTEITSTIIFKSKKKYNQNDFIGCLNPNKTTSSPTMTFSCSTMTPTMCERFCRAHGHSVAMLKQGTNCLCSEYAQVMSWDERKFSCSIPCGGDEETFCGGKETYSAYRTMPEWPDDFKFSSNGTLNSLEYRCTQIEQPNLSTSWNKTYLCVKKIVINIRLRWLSKKPREGILVNRRCIAINHASNSSSWKNNFLCLSKEVGLKFMWSYSGAIYGMKCLKMEAEESLGWEDNYLCTDRTENNQTMVSMLCPDRTVSRTHKPTMITHTQQRHINTSSLPHSSDYLPSQSTVASSGPKQDPNLDSKKKEKNYNELIPLYIFVTLISILCVLTFGVVTALYFKRQISKRSLNPQAQITNFDNPIWEIDKKSSSRKGNTGRKSRKERLPSLPAQTSETHPLQTLNATQESVNIPSQKTQNTPPENKYITPETDNATLAPITLAAIADRRSKTLEMESGAYAEIPMDSNYNPFNANNLEDSSRNRMYSNNNNPSGNPTYESIENFLNPECLYLEVLP